eukprot:scaffold4035_cov132-Isochrysis_galbana.AAC.11
MLLAACRMSFHTFLRGVCGACVSLCTKSVVRAGVQCRVYSTNPRATQSTPPAQIWAWPRRLGAWGAWSLEPGGRLGPGAPGRLPGLTAPHIPQPQKRQRTLCALPGLGRVAQLSTERARINSRVVSRFKKKPRVAASASASASVQVRKHLSVKFKCRCVSMSAMAPSVQHCYYELRSVVQVPVAWQPAGGHQSRAYIHIAILHSLAASSMLWWVHQGKHI